MHCIGMAIRNQCKELVRGGGITLALHSYNIRTLKANN